MNIIKLLQDFNVPYFTEGKNVSTGWIGVQCPFCDDTSNHLGIQVETGACSCWRCGGKHLPTAIGKLLGVSNSESFRILKEYGGRSHTLNAEKTRRLRPLRFPNTSKLKQRHKNYLTKRGFDPDKLEREWGLLATGPVAPLDGVDFRHRILAPIWWNNQYVSFQTRDVTGKHKLKYITCPGDREVIPHKNILYGKQDQWRKIGICVEGITDVWRLGADIAFATFGTAFTESQVNAITKHFEGVAVIFDDEPHARKQAEKLALELSFNGLHAFNMKIKGDPASLTDEEARELRYNVLSNF